MRRRLLTVILITGVVALTLYKLGELFSPGSYPNAEKYELEVTSSELIDLIQKFKAENPIYKVPDHLHLEDGRTSASDHWYHIYFYYHKENQIVYCWFRPEGRGRVTFAFVGINDSLDLGNWKMINKDFSRSENRQQIQLFEKRILDNIKNEISE